MCLKWWTRETQVMTSSGFIDSFHVLWNAELPLGHIYEELLESARCQYDEMLAIIWCAHLERVLLATWNEFCLARCNG